MARMKWDDSKAKRIVRTAGLKAINDVIEDIATDSQNEAPLLSGTMERSQAVAENRSQMEVYISYNTPYAIKQHEELGYRHAPGRKAKYLEDPFNRKKGPGLKYIEKKIKQALQLGR